MTSKQTSEWQDIETAPKDGSKIILGYPETPCDEETCYMSHVGEGYYHSWHKSFNFLNTDGRHTILAPTHWQPLPEAPKSSSQDWTNK